MPGSQTTQGRSDTRADVSVRVAFRDTYSVGTLRDITFAAQWLACTLPCRRFTDILTDAGARLGVNVGRYSFIATDFHRLLLAGLPAHRCLILLYPSFPAKEFRGYIWGNRASFRVRTPKGHTPLSLTDTAITKLPVAIYEFFDDASK